MCFNVAFGKHFNLNIPTFGLDPFNSDAFCTECLDFHRFHEERFRDDFEPVIH
jgi:hypothetical protein